MARAEKVTLRGGPCDGMSVTATVCKPWIQSPSLLMEDTATPGMVARYRPSREKGVYTFREYDRVIARVPVPPSTTKGKAA